jgi:prephenate dehydrogenase
VAVIGAGGRMGSWFVNYFASKNMSITAYDRNKASLSYSSSAIRIADDLAMCVEDADFVLVCVPVRLTPRLVNECASSMKSGAALGEISSVKQKTFSALAALRNDLVALCIHPMFGPGATDKNELRILLVPVKNERTELRKAQDLLPGTRLLVIPSPQEHDDAIGIVLGLTYFSNLAFADFLSSKRNTLRKEISGTTFALQSILAESIMTDDPELISVLIKDNPYARKHIREFLRKALAIERVLTSPASKLETRIGKLKSKMQSQGNLQDSYNLLYGAMRAMDSQKEK